MGRRFDRELRERKGENSDLFGGEGWHLFIYCPLRYGISHIHVESDSDAQYGMPHFSEVDQSGFVVNHSAGKEKKSIGAWRVSAESCPHIRKQIGTRNGTKKFKWSKRGVKVKQ